MKPSAVRTPGLLSPSRAQVTGHALAARLVACLRRTPCVLLALSVLIAAPEASAQVRPDSLQVDSLRADSVRALEQGAPPDSLAQQVDSARLAILERLQRLARPVGADSVLFLQDSVRLAQASQGVRPGMSSGGDSVSTELMRMPGFSMTQYEGESADFEAQRRVRRAGRVRP